MSSLKYWVWLSSLSGVAPANALRLLNHFGTPEKIYSASDSDLVGIEGLNLRRGQISSSRKSLDEANNILAACAQKHFRVITLEDSDYPDRLKNIYDPPIVLYVQGTLPNIDNEPVVSIVGTRNCTPYGIKTAEKIAYELSAHGIIVVTGLALGIDTAASYGSLRGGSSSLGVIGSGLDVIYPRKNKELFNEVSKRGAIISEYPPGSQPFPQNFPARNRILSGLSLGVLLIEAPKKSGALITAARALEQGRDVFVLPGNVDSPACEGSNLLLRDGAIPILSGMDIISEYEQLFPYKIIFKKTVEGDSQANENVEQLEIPKTNYAFVKTTEKSIDNITDVHYIDLGKLLGTLSGDEKAIAKAIGHETLHVDDIVDTTKLPAHQVLTALTMLEINGHAICEGSKFFRLASAN